jgi:hypothetical protein
LYRLTQRATVLRSTPACFPASLYPILPDKYNSTMQIFSSALIFSH